MQETNKLSRATSKTKRIWCGDYMHCSIKHQLKDGRKVVAFVSETWAEDVGGKRTHASWYTAYVGKQKLFYNNADTWRPGCMADKDPNLHLGTWGLEARFSSVETGIKVLLAHI